MAVAAVHIKLNSPGIQALLKSGGVQGDLNRRAANVARAAGDGVVARATPRARRGRAEAVTETYEARVRHATRGTMVRAITAARG